MLQKLKLLATMYPDEYRAYYNYAFFAHDNAQQYSTARDFLGPALSVHNPQRAYSYYQLGNANLALDQYKEALDAFKQFDSLGTHNYKRAFADTYAAQRQFAKAQSVLATQKVDALGGIALEGNMPDVSRATSIYSPYKDCGLFGTYFYGNEVFTRYMTYTGIFIPAHYGDKVIFLLIFSIFLLKTTF